MPALNKDELLDLRMTSIITSAEDAMFQRFDDLHKRGINDDDVIRYLRKQGYTDYADAYIEWSGALDPDTQDNNTTLDPIVPDPVDVESYEQLIKAYREGISVGVPEAHLELMSRALTMGTWVLYRPSETAKPIRGFVAGKVFVAAGVPLVKLIIPIENKIIEAAALTSIEIKPLGVDE